jgi:hypothetical protein
MISAFVKRGANGDGENLPAFWLDGVAAGSGLTEFASPSATTVQIGGMNAVPPAADRLLVNENASPVVAEAPDGLESWKLSPAEVHLSEPATRSART